MYRHSLFVWVPAGVQMTDALALQMVRESGSAPKYPPIDDPYIEIRPVEVHEDSAGFVHPGVDGRDYYLLEYDVDLERVRKAALCPPT
ncbi:hypothetical protein [Streptomyces sp. NPDC057115]|uniref:hypothetical protein n=1 Tax=Streptomyces sp. NPDC057115 TaxID=3346022 RepID=UPI00362F5374